MVAARYFDGPQHPHPITYLGPVCPTCETPWTATVRYHRWRFNRDLAMAFGSGAGLVFFVLCPFLSRIRRVLHI